MYVILEHIQPAKSSLFKLLGVVKNHDQLLQKKHEWLFTATLMGLQYLI